MKLVSKHGDRVRTRRLHRAAEHGGSEPWCLEFVKDCDVGRFVVCTTLGRVSVIGSGTGMSDGRPAGAPEDRCRHVEWECCLEASRLGVEGFVKVRGNHYCVQSHTALSLQRSSSTL